MIQIFESEKPSQIDTEYFNRLIARDDCDINIWMKYLAPYIVFGARNQEMSRLHLASNLRILLKVYLN